MEKRICTYTVNADDAIVRVGNDWSDFARENEAPHLDGKSVLFRSLYDFIIDARTRNLYRIILKNVRESNRPVELPFRCDSPDKRRFMKLLIQPQPERTISFHSELIREEVREPLKWLKNDGRGAYGVYGRAQPVMMCSMCKQIKISRDEWSPPETAISSMEIFSTDAPHKVLHSVCPACNGQVHEQCRRMQEEARAIRATLFVSDRKPANAIERVIHETYKRES